MKLTPHAIFDMLFPMRTLRFLLPVMFVSLLACKKDNGSKLPVIKGIYKRDIHALPVGMDGTPNVNTGGDALGFYGADLVTYPNPAGLHMRIGLRSDKGQARIWMVRGRYKEGKFGPDDILGVGLYIPIDMTESS